MKNEILTGKQARKKYRLKELKTRRAVILTSIRGDGYFELGEGPIVSGRDGAIEFFVDIGGGDLIGVFDNEQFCLLSNDGEYFKNLSAELQDYIDKIEPEQQGGAV